MILNEFTYMGKKIEPHMLHTGGSITDPVKVAAKMSFAEHLHIMGYHGWFVSTMFNLPTQIEDDSEYILRDEWECSDLDDTLDRALITDIGKYLVMKKDSPIGFVENNKPKIGDMLAWIDVSIDGTEHEPFKLDMFQVFKLEKINNFKYSDEYVYMKKTHRTWAYFDTYENRYKLHVNYGQKQSWLEVIKEAIFG